MTLLDSKPRPGHQFEITGFTGDQVYRERLHEMGLRVGTKVTVLGRAPFRGPLLVRFNTSFLALRNEEAACAQVKAL
ncbi:ferrous iron transporter A [Bdellovibrio bacteriovorus]|uniref:Ferrous iron transporter A n=1 Tax=Bdellovibrio bacteriovorus TaxID=959 RepID=A0A150WK32_BDEBC|nr:FeoA family protein [Bdellovibrio bacteriovorus]KYG64050.1 ferrous iron transporter A [Bdellovibrio bacteriovorus]